VLLGTELSDSESDNSAPPKAVSYGEVWIRLRQTENISDFHQVLLLFSAALGADLARIPGFNGLSRFVGNLLHYSVAYISPDLRFDFRRTIKEYNIVPILSLGFFAGLIVSLGYPMFFAWWSNTLWPAFSTAAPQRVSFFQDGKNLQIYTLVSPAYLALSLTIIITAFRGWLFLPQTSATGNAPVLASMSLGEPIPTHRLLHAMCMLLFVTLIPVWVNVNQFQSIMRVDPYKDGLYWFVDLSEHGDVRLNKAGVAYSVVNSVKFMIICAAAACYFASAAEMLRIASSAQRIYQSGEEALESWRERLRHYALIELLAKGLILVLAVHTSIFSKQPWQPQANGLLQALAILVVGLGLIPFPRYYFELRWLMEDRRHSSRDKWPDLRPRDLRVFFVLLSTVLYSSVAFFAVWLDMKVEPFALLLETIKRIWGG
jgi:hypothetical protein